MNLLYAVFLGVIQGATEFLPISSSGHLALAEHFFQIEGAGLTFDICLHMGTLIAILVYFRVDLLQLIIAFIGKDSSPEAPQRRRMCLYICVGCVPAVAAGLTFGHIAETMLRGPVTIAFTLSAAGFFLWLSEKKGAKIRTDKEITLKDALIIGCAQAMALIPGVSRSGSTITAGLFLGLNRSSAALFSFLLSAPIVFGAGIYKIPDVLNKGLDQSQIVFYLTGFISSAISGYFVISLLMKFVRTNSLAVFAYYRYGLSAIVVVALLLGY
jgi:undecaprenyl-diphosphatase